MITLTRHTMKLPIASFPKNTFKILVKIYWLNFLTQAFPKLKQAMQAFNCQFLNRPTSPI